MKLRVHHIVFGSRANGPGKRAVIWLQGCSLQCPGCVNPVLQDPEGGYAMMVPVLVKELISHEAEIEGITLSGGEPVEQIESLIELLSTIKANTHFSVLLFTGYTLSQIQAMKTGTNLLSLVDVLVDGPFDKSVANPEGVWPSSSNQNLIMLTSRYSTSDFQKTYRREFFINPAGEIIETGLFG